MREPESRTSAVRGRWVLTLPLLALAAIVGAMAFLYQPLALGSISGLDEHLLIDTRTPAPGTDGDLPIHEYRFHASTSYHTLFSVRNLGPLPVTILGIDSHEVPTMIPFVGPVELRLGSPKNDPGGTVGWSSAAPLLHATVASGSDLALWIRWEIGPCDADHTQPYLADSGIALDSIPLQWSVLGIPRTTRIALPYVVAFEVTAEGFDTQCAPAVARLQVQQPRHPSAEVSEPEARLVAQS
jgi:hypothetical protein